MTLLFIFFMVCVSVKMTAYCQPSFTVADMTSMNRYLQGRSFFRGVTLEEKNIPHSRCSMFACFILATHFNFTRDLATRLAQFNTNLVDVSVRSYFLDHHRVNKHHAKSHDMTRVSNIISQKANVSINQDGHQMSCRAGSGDSVVCYERLITMNETNQTISNSTRRMLDSVSFLIDNSNETISYIVCIKFVSAGNSDFYFFTENMCLDGLVLGKKRHNHNNEHEHEDQDLPHSFRYKPLFIVIMYGMCFSLLGAIAIAHHILAKAKAKKLLLMKQLKRRASRSRRASGTSRATAGSGNDPTKPLLETSQVKSTQSINSNKSAGNKPSSLSRTESYEAEHILNDKPWACRATQNIPTSLSGAAFYLEEETSQELKNAENNNGQDEANKPNIVKEESPSVSLTSFDLNKNTDVHPELLLPESNLINSRRSFNLSSSKLITKPYMVLETHV